MKQSRIISLVLFVTMMKLEQTKSMDQDVLKVLLLVSITEIWVKV